MRALRAWREETDTRGVVVARPNGFGATSDALARLAKLEWGEPEGELLRIGSVEIAAPQIDAAALEAKRAARRGQLEREIERAAGKLANGGFVAKAPDTVVQAERDKLDRLRAELESL